ncbi:ABC transporter ATP-binding protein [Caulobacter sp. 17J65-9]|uniref:ATP-binding cassette domain-containing protein n=1 Tax=Caulobacter sp. 17J65-9 TaxID=2709382 RepID=UPI0013CB2341|nr:ABC transporter ATP-binding protein [Caulobacter sp. 17J65-9]NEX92578.1 ABC transporter ATP-binding protein [Caulobacter sp. 17J65-9]
MLTIEHLGRREGRLQILDDVSFSWPKGLLAVIGGNGTGKSTLLRVVAGAKAPNTGKAGWNGVSTARAARQKGRVGYGPQERNLDLAITLREFLSLCCDLRGLSDRGAKVAAVAEELGLSGQLDERLANLSGGGKRKAMTAQALLGAPELIVLDEPTSEVDYAASRRFWAAFKTRGQSAALVVATHDLEMALAAADAILLLRRGQPLSLKPAAEFSLDELSAAIADH